MSLTNNLQLNNIMHINKNINYNHNNSLSSLVHQLNPCLINVNNNKNKNKSGNNKNITFSSVEQFLHYKMTGRKPHPKVKFTPPEDELLRNLVQEYGENDNWSIIAKKMTITYRNQRQCKERWFNYLSPSINNTPLTSEEDKKLEELYEKYGAKWVQIAKYFPSRTDINIRSRWLVLQRRKKKLESKQSSDVSPISPVLSSSNTEINYQNYRTSNLPVPQIKQNSIIQNNMIMNDIFLQSPSNIQSALPENQNPTELTSTENNSSLYGNMFSLDDEKGIYNDENFFNITPVELSTNDLNPFEDWNF